MNPRTLFAPASSLMSRLRFVHKFGLLGLLVLAAVIVLQVSLYFALDRVIAPSRFELRGLDAIVQLNQTVQLVQQHRGVTAALLGGLPAMAERERSKALDTERAFADLAAVLPKTVAASERWRAIAADWADLRAQGLALDQRSNTVRHGQLVAAMLLLATDVADASALTLDPDIGSFYLMDTLIKLPFFTERLGQARAFGAGILARKQVTDLEKLDMAALLGHIEIARQLQQSNLEKVGAYNPALRASLQRLDAAVAPALKRALAMVQNDIVGAGFGTSAPDYLAHYTDLIDQLYAGGNEVLAPALRTHIENRIAQARGRLALTVAVSVLVSLVFAYLACGTYLALSRQIGQVLEALRALAIDSGERAEMVEAIAAGDLSRDVPQARLLVLDVGVTQRDEIGALVDAMRAMGSAQHSLGRGFARMTHTLRQHRADERDLDWAKSGMNALNIEMRGDRPLDQMAQAVIGYLTEHVGAAVGALYLYDEQDGQLHLAAGHGLPPGHALRSVIALGQGLAGEAARARRAGMLAPVPANYLPVVSALGQATPAAVLALPLQHDGMLMGVIELGSFGALDAQRQAWLEQAGEALAIAIGVEQARLRVGELLAQTQTQTEELRVQQEQLQQSNEELEERAQLLEQQRETIRLKSQESEAASRDLQRKADELERISAYKSEFLANMSHELRTPLNSMLILSSLLQQNKEGKLSDKQVEYARTIHGAGKDLLNLINDILDLSKIEAGRLELHAEDIDLRQLGEQLRQLFGPLAEHQQLAFAVALDAQLPALLHADPQRVGQILNNLLGNALKFTPAGKVSLRVSSAAPSASGLAGPALAFAVTDSGIGIHASQHEQIFHAFQQADGSTSRKFGGTGLGLSISRQLARGMGGEIALASMPGSGSTFTLYLPLVAAVPMPAAAPVPMLAPPPARPMAPAIGDTDVDDDRAQLAPGGRTILIIEDDRAFAGILRDTVRARGFQALVATDGEAGLAMAARYAPQAILLDVMLPHIDGWGVMRSIKDDPATRHIPVHFITCLEDRQRALGMGAIGFVTKPVSADQLEQVLADIGAAIDTTMRRLLVVEDNEAEAMSVVALLDHAALEIVVARSGAAALALLARESFDAMVLDLGLQDMTGFEVLDRLQAQDCAPRMPVIVHSGRSLSEADAARLRRYTDSIIVKGAKSPERLLGEVSLFLHLVESSLPQDRQGMIRRALDKEAMFERRKVLLVDDDIRNIFSLSSVLGEKGMQIVEAANGHEALAQLEAHPDIDIVLMDIMMPDMDGYEAMRRIRQNPRHARLPIIALTAKAMVGDQQLCLAAGASDYLSKPVDLDKMFSLMRVWLYQAGAA
ncbi:MAG: response regulator [Pseudomonadota bacterium]